MVHWTQEEEDRLLAAMIALVEQFPGRSFAAVVTRIIRLAPKWRR